MRYMKYGTREHAESLTGDRHPGVKDALQWLTFSHLPETLQRFSRPFYAAAVELVETGRAGSIPRPQDVPLIDNRIGPNFGRPIQDRPQA